MFILNTNNGLFQHFIPILRGCHSLFLLETLTEITRVIDTHHIGYLRHGILTGGYQLSCTVDTHFLNELDRRQSGQGFQLLEEYGTAHGKFLHKIIYYRYPCSSPSVL